LAGAGNTPVSTVIEGAVFVVPTLVPQATVKALEEYFTTLVDGLLPLWERLKDELPEWAAAYRFADEAQLIDAKLGLTKQISDVEKSLDRLNRFKRVLALQCEPLVDAVMELLEDALPLKVKRDEAFREDLVLIDQAGKSVAFVEIKGVNRGLAREHVNQADSHRERGGLPPEFPSLLIVNTNMKGPTSIDDKDQPIASEQVQHAVRNNVLILRTLDLLNLSNIYRSGKLSSERIVELLTESRGWLRIGDAPEVLTG
jgi:hypothetical protein